VIQKPSAAPRSYRVPERNGEVLIDPPLAEVPGLLRAGREAGEGAAVLGTPLRQFRREAAARALALAAHRAGGDAADGAGVEAADALAGAGAPEGADGARGAAADRALVVMGHQPVFFHPGVWVKFFLLTRLGEQFGVAALHLRVDTDAPGAVAAEIPARAGRLLRRTETLTVLPGDAPLEAAPPPDDGGWRGFCARVRSRVETLADRELLGRFDAFAAEADRVRRGASSLGAFLAGARRAWEARAGAPRYAELPVSALAETPEFRAFALHLLADPAGFRARYNAILDAYRGARRLRSAANPFPNLGEAGGYQEAPFWTVAGGRRHALFVRRTGDRLHLRTPASDLGDIPAGRAGVEALHGLGIALRPRALTLTMFVRLCLADLFVHGVGGARYDEATDAVIADVFRCAPPPYLVASASLMLPLASGGAVEESEPALARRLMELQHNPERAGGAGIDRRLVDEKWALVRAVAGMRPGPARREATRRIREINRRLAAPFAAEIADVQAKLRALRDGGGDAAAFRGYPFFLFDPAAVARLVAAPGPH
jgi:hypothetical protein